MKQERLDELAGIGHGLFDEMLSFAVHAGLASELTMVADKNPEYRGAALVAISELAAEGAKLHAQLMAVDSRIKSIVTPEESTELENIFRGLNKGPKQESGNA